MRGLIKTLFGDARHLVVVAGCIIVTLALLHTCLAPAAAFVLPVSLLAGAAYLAKR
jgi:hypothetical protein